MTVSLIFDFLEVAHYVVNTLSTLVRLTQFAFAASRRLLFPNLHVIQLDLVNFIRSQHLQPKEKLRAFLVIRVLVVEQHLVIQVVIHRVARDADHPI